MLVVQPCKAQSAFDIKHGEGLSRNPAAVTFLLQIEGDRSTFHLFETIPIMLEFSSTRPRVYSIELDEFDNAAGSAQRVEVEPRDAVLRTFGEWGTARGFVCCWSDRPFLKPQPTILHRELTDFLRFDKPGTYRIYFATQRVFDHPRSYDDFGPSKMVLTSNVVTLTILPDDPDWDSQRLTQTLSKLHDVTVQAGYAALLKKLEAMGSSTASSELRAKLDQTDFLKALKTLNALDTEEAISARVEMMRMLSKDEIESERRFGDRTLLPEPLFASSTRPDLVVACMETRARNPNFGVDYNYAEEWSKYATLRDHRDLLRPSDEDPRSQMRSFFIFEIEAKKDVIHKLESSLDAKTEQAKATTALAIQALESDIEVWEKAKTQVPATVAK